MRLIDITGKKFGRLTALFRNGKTKDGRYIWHCVCECGSECNVPSSYLTSGNTKSCGCLQPEVARKIHLKHGDCPYGKKASKLYTVWAGMKNRCTVKSHIEYQQYGGRGIRVCDEWSSDYTKFKKWALDHGYEEGLQVDRIDNDKGYSPENCRFVTRKENSNNRQNTIRVLFDGELKTITELSEITGIPRHTIYQRVRHGWDASRLSEPLRRKLK